MPYRKLGRTGRLRAKLRREKTERWQDEENEKLSWWDAYVKRYGSLIAAYMF